MSNPMYQAFVLVPPTHTPTTQAAEAAIRALYAPVSDRVSVSLLQGAVRQAIGVKFGGYQFMVVLMDGPGIVAESREVAEYSAKERPDQALIASCPARFEVSAQELDDSISYSGAYMQLIELLEELYPGAIPFEPGSANFQTNATRSSFLRPPAAAPVPTPEERLATAREAVAGVELIAEKKPVKAKRPPRPRAPAKKEPVEDEEETPARKPLAKGKPLARGGPLKRTPLKRGGPLKRSGGLTRKTPLARGKGLTRKTPLARGKPMERGKPIDRAAPAKGAKKKTSKKK